MDGSSATWTELKTELALPRHLLPTETRPDQTPL